MAIIWNQLISDLTNIVGNVYGRKNVVMKHMKAIMVLYIGSKKSEKKAWLIPGFMCIFRYKKWEIY